MVRRAHARAVAALACTAVLAGCGEPASDDSSGVTSAGVASVTVRLWDDGAADAYRESFDAFNAIHPDIHVDVEVVRPETYADRVTTDLAAGTMADIFWTTSDAVAAHAGSGDIVGLDDAVGDEHEEWEPSLTALYTHDDQLWAVPQLWDTTVMFYNTDLVGAAGVDPAALTWDPTAARESSPVSTSSPTDTEPTDGDPTEPTADANAEADAEPTAEPTDAPGSSDTLRRAVRDLTRDTDGRSAGDEDFDPTAVAEYGINTDLTAPAVWLPLLAQLGAVPDTASLSLTGPEARAVFTYLSDLSPAPAPEQPALSRDLFTEGRLALFQSTSADMHHLVQEAEIDWGMAPVPAGPDGAVAVVDGVAAAANAASEDPDATVEVLRWMASTDGQSALASHGVGVPAVVGAQALYLRSWSDRGVDASAAVDSDEVVTTASGPQAQEVLEAVRPVLAEIFTGELRVAEALTAAQQAADAALES